MNYNNQSESEAKSQYPPPPVYPGPPLATNQGPPPGPSVYTSATIVVAPAMGSSPAQHTCPSCRQLIVTRIEKKTTTKTHFMAVLLCAFLMWPCVFIPYCMDSCKSIDHYCPNCNAYIGAYKN